MRHAFPTGGATFGPMLTFPETEEYLSGLADVLLTGPSSLTPAEREVIATYVSSASDYSPSTNAQPAANRPRSGSSTAETVDRVTTDFRRAPVSDKLGALLVIAAKVQQGGRRVTDEDIARARARGADHKAIHDTVLIASVFCIYNVCERIGAGLARGGCLHAACPEFGPAAEGSA